MTNDVKEAMERRRNNASPHYVHSGKSYEDADLLADAYLAETDETLVDECWLKSVGRAIPGFICFDGMGITVTVSRDKRDRWMVELLQDDLLIALGEYRTRGQLVMLCRALGIPLKPAASEGGEG